MQRTVKTFSVDDIKIFKTKILQWSQQFETAIWMDSNDYHQQYSSFDFCVAVDEFTAIKTDFTNAFDKLKEYQTITKDYIFGYISYDVKNDVEQLTSTNFDGLDFADLYFFQPQKIIFFRNNQLEFHYLNMVDDEIDNDFQTIQQSKNLKIQHSKNDLKIKLRIHKDEYHKKVEQMLHNMQ